MNEHWICKSNDLKNLTYGKAYELRKPFEKDGRHILVKDDAGRILWYMVKHFAKPQVEIRFGIQP